MVVLGRGTRRVASGEERAGGRVRGARCGSLRGRRSHRAQEVPRDSQGSRPSRHSGTVPALLFLIDFPDLFFLFGSVTCCYGSVPLINGSGSGRGERLLPSLEQELALAGEGAEARQALSYILYHSQFEHNNSVPDP